MKISVTFIALLLTFANLAQSDSTNSEREYKFGFQLGTSLNSNEFTFMINPLITHSNHKHQFEVGPKFYTRVSNGGGTHIGAEANYKYYPNSKHTPFSSFLLINNEFFYRKTSFSYADAFSIPNETHDITRTYLNRIYQLHLGYGIEWKFWGQLYITSDVGFGGYYQLFRGDEMSDEPTLNSSWGSGYFGLSARASVSLGWRFN